MLILLTILTFYILSCISLYFVFQKVGVPAWKALVPGFNFYEITKLIGAKPTRALWMLFPIVNIFTWAGLKVDLARSFNQLGFWDSAKAVLCSPLIFWKMGHDPKVKYEGAILPREEEYQAQLAEAYKKGEQSKIDRLIKNNPFQKSQPREWAEAIFFAVFAAAFIRMFLIEAYTIPTSSMEGSLLVGDFMFVSKAHYGIRTPSTILQIPLLHNTTPFGGESYVNWPNLSSTRLPALQEIQRNSPLVFNYPEGDSVYVTPERTWTVSDLVRNPYLKGAVQGYPLVVRPMDKEDFYIKRCVGVAGDTLEIRNRQVYVNGQPSPNASHLQFSYRISGAVSSEKLEEMGVHITDHTYYSKNYYNLNNEQVEKIRDYGGDVKVELQQVGPGPSGIANSSPGIPQAGIFPHDTVNFKWNVDNFGPLYIPKKGASVNLTPQNIALYRRLIRIYEKNTLEEKDGKFLINGQETTTYTFKQNYYWLMGDNRHNSDDARFWGFVPHENVVGKPLFIWFSTKNGSIRNGINWSRIFTGANKM
jgi:signal peptidase I